MRLNWHSYLCYLYWWLLSVKIFLGTLSLGWVHLHLMRLSSFCLLSICLTISYLSYLPNYSIMLIQQALLLMTATIKLFSFSLILSHILWIVLYYCLWHLNFFTRTIHNIWSSRYKDLRSIFSTFIACFLQPHFTILSVQVIFTVCCTFSM